ncbi:hypothetical protein [Actinophytocola sp.]|uniref:hypothetical protein n=1 Tax=Actinophytocola sp. TaxID=1872138 RepID=UPI002D6548B2|nr:hypothetical protein [Actinophytocola sp.]HYQ69053.1 hypothetical protein [Actinophytocola sp.]
MTVPPVRQLAHRAASVAVELAALDDTLPRLEQLTVSHSDRVTGWVETSYTLRAVLGVAVWAERFGRAFVLASGASALREAYATVPLSGEFDLQVFAPLPLDLYRQVCQLLDAPVHGPAVREFPAGHVVDALGHLPRAVVA